MKLNERIKRVFSLLLCLFLVLQYVPVTAFAADGAEQTAAPAAECICQTACGGDNGIAPNCPVCQEDFWLCAHFDPTACTCAEKCTEETVNSLCPVCGTGEASLVDCNGKARSVGYTELPSGEGWQLAMDEISGNYVLRITGECTALPADVTYQDIVVESSGNLNLGSTTVDCIVINFGTISGGRFTHAATNNNKISGGIFEGTVRNNAGSISGGTFFNTVHNNGGGMNGVKIIAGAQIRGTLPLSVIHSVNGVDRVLSYGDGAILLDVLGEGTWYAGNTQITETDNVPLYYSAYVGQYSITVPGNLTGGSVTADKTTAKYGEKVTLTVTPTSGHVLKSLTVSYGEDQNVSVSGNQFTMPASAVTVSAAFAACDHSGNQVADQGDGTHGFTCIVCETAVSEKHSFDTDSACMLCSAAAAAKIVTGEGETASTTYYGTLEEALAVGGNVYPLANCAGDFRIPEDVDFYGSDFTFTGKVTSVGTIYSGTFTGEVFSNGVIAGGTFKGTLNANAIITGGIFEGPVTSHSAIAGGTFEGEVTHYVNAITGGIFKGTVTANASIFGGTFEGSVINNGTVDAGTFNGAVTNNGTFKNTSEGAIILGANFSISKDGVIDCSAHIEGREATCTQRAVCRLCESEYGEWKKHVFDSSDGKCDTCGSYIAAISYQVGDSVTHYSYEDVLNATVLYFAESGTVTLYRDLDVSADNCLQFGGNECVLDLNGYTLTSYDVTALYTAAQGGSLHVKGPGKIVGYDNGSSYVPGIYIRPGTEVKMNAGIEIQGHWSFVLDSGTLDLTACTDSRYTVKTETALTSPYESILLPEGYCLMNGANVVGRTEAVAEQTVLIVSQCTHTFDANSGKCALCHANLAVAQNGQRYYTDLKSAVENAVNGTVILLKDAILSESASIPPGITLSGNKFKVSGERLNNMGIICDGTFENDISNANPYEGAKGTISGGTFSGKVVNQGNITGGTFTGTLEYQGGTVSGGTYSGKIVIGVLPGEGGIDLRNAAIGASLLLTGTANLTEPALIDKHILLPAGYCSFTKDGRYITQVPNNWAEIFVKEHTHSITYDQTSDTHTAGCTCCYTEPAENHSFGYTTTDHVIHRSCTICGYTSGTATIRCSGGLYTGNSYAAEVITTGTIPDGRITYSQNGVELNCTPTEAGTYTAALTVETGSVSVSYSISYLTPPEPAFAVNGGYWDGYAYWFKDGMAATVAAPDGYSISAALNSTYGASLSLSENDRTVYLRRDSDGAMTDGISVSECIRYDSTAPTGKIEISGAGTWNDLLKHVDYKLFFEGSETLHIAAADACSGVHSIQYYVADTDLIGDASLTDAAAIVELEYAIGTGWQSFDGSTPVGLIPGKQVIYVKILDQVGNAAYLSSDGIILYQDAQAVTGSVNTTYNAGEEKAVAVSFNGNKVKQITNGMDLLDPADYTVSSDAITLKAEYLDTLQAGEYTFTVSYHPLGEIYVDAPGNDAPKITQFTLTVDPIKVEIPAANTTEFQYNGGLQIYPIADSEYYTVTGNQQTEAGEYTVTVSLRDKRNCVWADGTVEDVPYQFVIGRKTLVITAKDHEIIYGDAPAANGVVYEGFAGSEREYVLEGTLAYSYSYRQFEDAGTYRITPSGLTAKNYDIVFSDGTLLVSPKPITGADVKLNGSLTYNSKEQTQEVTVTEGITYEVTGNKETNAGAYEMTVKGTGNYTGSVNVKWNIAKAAVTITADNKVIYVGADLPTLTYTVSGLMTGDELTKVPTLTTDADKAKAGSYTITAANADASDNYTITYASGTLTVMNTETEVETKIEHTELTKVPAGLKDTPFNTVEAITEELISRILAVSTGYAEKDLVHYDVTLQFSLEGGNTWIHATEENFPTEGITVILPYPEGTNPRDYEFVVSHMFTVTSQRLGTIAGDVELPKVEETANGIRVTLNGLSPVTVAARYHDHTGGTATCTDKAICSICGNAYGEVDKTNHAGGTEVKGAKEATCGAEGYTGDTCCKGCDEVVEKGTIIKASGEHTYGNWKVVKKATKTAKGEKQRTCSVCGDVESREIPRIADTPATGDDFNIVLYGAMFTMSLAALIVLLLASKKRKQVS